MKKVNKPFLQDFAKAIRTDPIKADKSFYGVVKGIIEDKSGKVRGYRISLGGEDDIIECRKFAGADIGDTVMVTLMANGTAVVTGRRDGDGDALKADEKAQSVVDRADRGEFKGDPGEPGEKGDTGEPGEPGRGISSSTIEYAISDDGNTAPSTGWQGTIPTPTTKKPYIWSRTHIVYTSGSPASSDIYSVSKNGTPGTPGDPGKGISNIVEQWARGTSLAADSASWSTTPPLLTSDYPFLWYRQEIQWTNPTETTYSPSESGVKSTMINELVTFRNLVANEGYTTINGSKIVGGTIKLGGNGNGNGQMEVYNAGNVRKILMNCDGINIDNTFVYSTIDGTLDISANKIDIESLDTIEPVLTVHGTEIVPDEEDSRYTLTLDCTTEFNNSGYQINYEHTEKFNSTINRIVTAKTLMAGESFSINSSEANYQHESGKSSNLLLSTDGLQFGTTFYNDARLSEFSSQQECMLAFSGLSFTNYPDNTKNYNAKISLNSDGNIVFSGTGWNGSTASSPVIVAQGCYKYTQSGSTLTINSSGTIKRSSSSRKLKENIKSELKTDVKALYDIKVVQFKYKEGVLEETDEWYGKNIIGFIAEQVNEVFPEGVIHSGENFENCDDWNPRTIIPAMLKLIQEQHEEIESLKEKVVRLEV